MIALVAAMVLGQASITPSDAEVERVWRVAVSGLLCAHQRARENATARIREQQKYAKLGGVLNATKVDQYQDQVRQLDGVIGIERGHLREAGVKPLKCADSTVRGVAACIKIEWHRGFVDSPVVWQNYYSLATSWIDEGDCTGPGLSPYKNALAD